MRAKSEVDRRRRQRARRRRRRRPADDPRDRLRQALQSTRSQGNPARSDTMILVRLNPDRGATALLSIPRDLRPRSPATGPSGSTRPTRPAGAKLALRTVRKLLDVPIHHVVEVNFGGFRRAVDRLDCVYADIDRRYYHSNTGLPPSQHYAEINIKPGYQKLCGKRGARLRALPPHGLRLRARRAPAGLPAARPRASSGSASSSATARSSSRSSRNYTRTDIRSNEAILRLLKLAFQSVEEPDPRGPVRRRAATPRAAT